MHLVTSCYSAASHPRADLSGKENKLGIIKQTQEKENGTENKVWKRYNGSVCHRPTSRVPYGIPGGYPAVFVRGMQSMQTG